MRDDDCARFLQWALPRLGLRWEGFRKVRGQVCKRIARRMRELELEDVGAYRDRLDRFEVEWRVLDEMCRVTISRLWRDRETFRALESVVLPELATAAEAEGAATLDVWSCGCASGEEPHSVAMLWEARLAGRFPALTPRILATDVDLHLLQRAGRAAYPTAAAREVPTDVAARTLRRVGEDGGGVRIADGPRRRVHRVVHDVRTGAPGGPFHLILCRNLVFTYFDDERQRTVGARLVDSLRPGGALVVGGHENPPAGLTGVQPWPELANVMRRQR